MSDICILLTELMCLLIYLMSRNTCLDSAAKDESLALPFWSLRFTCSLSALPNN